MVGYLLNVHTTSLCVCVCVCVCGGGGGGGGGGGSACGVCVHMHQLYSTTKFSLKFQSVVRSVLGHFE